MGTTKTEIFENKFMRVVVPDKWLAFLGIDSEGNTSPKKLHIFKDACSEMDLFTHTGITVCYYEDANLGFLIREFYDDIIDITPFELGNYKWKGFLCRSFGYPYVMLETCDCYDKFIIMILTENGEHQIKYQDEDVQEILKSIAATK